MNIAFFCIPAHGHTNPTLAVVREADRARTHRPLLHDRSLPCEDRGRGRGLCPL
ncbi:MAG: hypothetical protein ACLRX4_07190 [Oscillospiraceae bacterium]